MSQTLAVPGEVKNETIKIVDNENQRSAPCENLIIGLPTIKTTLGGRDRPNEFQ